MDWLARVQKFEASAHQLLVPFEGANGSRIIKLEESYGKLDILNLKQDDLFRQALRCTEQGLYRAAHVMCWAACMDFIQEKLQERGMAAIYTAYPNWQRVKDVAELAEYVPEAQLVDALQKLGLATKGQTKALQGLLHRRNECAHPTTYYPAANETLGYISETLQRIQSLD
jgi:hypothetical protein